jgi:hypothetical protein
VVVGGKPATDRMPELLRAAAAKVADGAEWIPMGEDEWTIEVDGPDDLPARLKGAEGVMDVYPSSEMSYY